MINFNKSVIVLLIAAGTAFATVPAQAQSGQPVTFASITGGGAGISSVFTYTPGVTGGFSITPGAQFIASFPSTFTTNSPATVVFTGLNNIGTVTGGPSNYSQALSGGSFSVVSGGVNLLSGTFDGGNILDGTTGSFTPTIKNTLTNVIYTGGTYFTQSGLANPGSFSISMTSAVPALGGSGGYFDSFQAGGTGTFQGASVPAAVPEPATIVPFLFGGLGLLALAVRKTRKAAGVIA